MESSFLNPTVAVKALELMPGQTVADFDAGSGFFARAAARLVAPGTVWAVDANREILSHITHVALAEGLRNVEVVAGNIERVGGSNLPQGSCDAVIIANSLFSVDHKEGVAAEAARVLRPGGKALVIDWEDSFGGLGPAPEHVVARADIEAAFAAAGCTLLAAEVGTGRYHWGCIVKKA